MASDRIHQSKSDRQSDRNFQQTRGISRLLQTETPLEVAEVAPGAMMDNVMRSTADSSPDASPQVLLQPKLAIGEPGDKYEQEADRMAKEVVQRIRAPIENNNNLLQRRTQIPFNTAGDRLAPTEIEAETLQSKTEAYRQIWGNTLQASEELDGGMVNDNFEGELNRARSGGQPLEPKLQNRMGEAFGADFSRVKVHTDSQSHQLNQSIQAKAFTTGKDIFFKAGEYQPGSQSGQELIAHELTHVVQQNGNAIQKKEGQGTKSDESLVDSIQRQSEPIIQRFWDSKTYVTLPQTGKNIANASIYQYTKNNGQIFAFNPSGGAAFMYQKEYDIICNNYYQGYFTFQPQKSEDWYCIAWNQIKFDGCTITQINEARQEWEKHEQLPTYENSLILSFDEIEQLQKNFAKLSGDERQNLIKAIISSNDDYDLEYRLKGYLKLQTLDEELLSNYAEKQAKIVERERDWESFKLNSNNAIDNINCQLARDKFIELDDGNADIFEAIIRAIDRQVRSSKFASEISKQNSKNLENEAVQLFLSNTSVGEIKTQIDNKLKTIRREDDWIKLKIETDLEQAKTNYLKFSDEDARKFAIALYDARNESKEQAQIAIVGLHLSKTVDNIIKDISQKAATQAWDNLKIEQLFDNSNQTPSLAKEKYLQLSEKEAKKLAILLSGLNDFDKTKAVTAFAKNEKNIKQLIEETRQQAKQSRKETSWNSFLETINLDNVNINKVEKAKQQYLQVSEEKSLDLAILFKELQHSSYNDEDRMFVIDTLSQTEKEAEDLARTILIEHEEDLDDPDELTEDDTIPAQRKIMQRIKATYKVIFDQEAGKTAIRKQYGDNVFQQLETEDWSFRELQNLEESLEHFAALLGDRRKRSRGKQTLKTLSRLEKGAKDKDNLSETTMGETFSKDKNVSLYARSIELSDQFAEFAEFEDIPLTEKEQQRGSRGVMTHEFTHALIADLKVDAKKIYEHYIDALDFWTTKLNPTFGGTSNEERIENGKVHGVEVPITNYGAQTAEEDLCEAVMFYFEEPATLQRKCPERYKFIEDKIKPLLETEN